MGRGGGLRARAGRGVRARAGRGRHGEAAPRDVTEEDPGDREGPIRRLNIDGLMVYLMVQHLKRV